VNFDVFIKNLLRLWYEKILLLTSVNLWGDYPSSVLILGTVVPDGLMFFASAAFSAERLVLTSLWLKQEAQEQVSGSFQNGQRYCISLLNISSIALVKSLTFLNFSIITLKVRRQKFAQK
ncbi:hypothetical protein, partial [Vibrio cholerae]|uniref:hypothetical protein n=1 Tax=Vibrio cholerae TaxID=666 RepID=UPI001C8D62A8